MDIHDDPAELFRLRISAARLMIAKAGGPSALSKAISLYLGEPISVDRIAKWRYTGVPVHMGVIVEHVTGFPRERLNPWEYIPNSQVANTLSTARSVSGSKD